MPISEGPWHASAPHPQTGGCVITNPQGRVIAATVPNKADADFICEARAAHHMKAAVQIDWQAFGQAVATARKARRYSQAIAADLCGISRNYMSMLERGIATDPSYTIVLTLCRWLDLEMPQ